MNDANESIFGRSPPPRKDDILFGPSSEDWSLNACIQHYGNIDYAYRAGFRSAALQLAERMCEKPIDQDAIVYPIAYLYRHYVELMLKDIFYLAVDLREQTVSKKQEDHLGRHDLKPLWSMVRDMLDPICEMAGVDKLPIADIEGIDAYMFQLNTYDPKGMSFRYARRLDTTRTLDTALMHINIRSFAIHMEKLVDYLDGLANWLGILVDSRNEARG